MRRAIAALPDGEYVYEAHLESRARAAGAAHRARPRGRRGRHHHRRPHRHLAADGRAHQRRPGHGADRRLHDRQVVPRSRLRRELRRLPAAHGDHPARHDRQRQSAGAVRRHGRGEVLRGDRGEGALAQALDGKVAGDLKGGGNHCYVGGPDPQTGETFIFYEYPAGGTGGFDGGDGSNTVRAWTESDMTTLQPIEAVEQLYPVRVERDGAARGFRRARAVARRPRAHARGAHPGAAHAAVGAGREGGAAAVRRVRRRPPARRIASGSGATDGPVSPRRCRGR